MDLLLSMNLNRVIQHKAVEEVLNLVYDGKYSIDSSVLYLSSLWTFASQMATFSQKSCWDKLVLNINKMGDWRLKKQSSI